MNKQIHIMLVEDHAGYRETIAIALEQSDNMQLGSQFGTAEIALRALQNTASPKQPDVILLDLNLPGMSGLEALPWIKEYAPIPRSSSSHNPITPPTSHGRSPKARQAIC